MADKDKLLKYVEGFSNNFTDEDIIVMYAEKFSARELSSLIQRLQKALDFKVNCLEHTKFVAKERAGYLKCYLSGDMWNTEEEAKRNLQPQIDNAQAIIDSCNEKGIWWY